MRIFEAQPLSNGTYYKDKKKKYVFYYYSEEQFEDLKEDAVIVGNVNLKKEAKENEDRFRIVKDEENFDFKLLEPKKKAAFGYIKVGENEYVRILKGKGILPILLLLLMIGGIGTGIWIASDGGKVNPITSENLTIADGSDWDGKMPSNGQETQASSEMTEIPGYADLYVTKEKPKLQLINPTNNTVYFVYTISVGGKEIYKSDAIAPGKVIEWNAAENLSKGEHQATFQISTYDVETQTGCNGATQDVKITVK